MTASRHSGRPWLRWFLTIAAAAVLVLVARGVDWSRTWDAIAHADPSLIVLATAANLATIVVKAIRWSLFLRAAGVPGIGLAIRATFAGAALNSVVVANGGDAARVAAVARRANVSSARVLATLAVDKLCDLATYVVLFVSAAFALHLPPELARWQSPGVALAIVMMLAGVAFVWWRRRRGPESTGANDGHSRLVSRARAYWERLVATTAAIATWRRILTALVLAFVAWGAQWATFHFAAHAASLATTPAVSLIALLVVNVSFLVRLTPGNVGVFQLLYALAATSAGLDRDRAVAVAFIIAAIQYIPVMAIGLPLAPSLARPHQSEAALSVETATSARP